MIKTLQVSVPVSGKPALLGLTSSLTHCGMHVYRTCVTELNRGMLVTVVTNCAGDFEDTLRELAAILPASNQILVEDEVPLFH